MAKKSAYSKGFRKTVQKDKPFLTKKEIIALIAIVVVIALAIVLFNLLYKPFKEGEIGSRTSTANRKSFDKLGLIGEVEGYTRTATPDSLGVYTYTFAADTPAEGYNETVRVQGSPVNAATLTQTNMSYGGDAVKYSELKVEDVQGQQAYYFGQTYDYYQATEEELAAQTAAIEEGTEETETEEKPSNTFVQSLTCYIAVDDSHNIVVNILRTGDNDSFYVPDEEIIPTLDKFVSAVTVRENDRSMTYEAYQEALKAYEEAAAETTEEPAETAPEAAEETVTETAPEAAEEPAAEETAPEAAEAAPAEAN